MTTYEYAVADNKQFQTGFFLVEVLKNLYCLQVTVSLILRDTGMLPFFLVAMFTDWLRARKI